MHPRPWDSPGKNTGVGCHFLLQCMKVKSESEVVQSCTTLCNPMDCSLSGSSIHGIFQARVLEWVAIAFSTHPYMTTGKTITLTRKQNCVSKVMSLLFNMLSRLVWRRQWQPTSVLLPGKSHGWRSLVGCSPWGR